MGQIMYAHKTEDGKFYNIFDSVIKLKMCFPNLQPTNGKFVKVMVAEIEELK